MIETRCETIPIRFAQGISRISAISSAYDGIIQLEDIAVLRL